MASGPPVSGSPGWRSPGRLGHAMGLYNPECLAQIIAGVIPTSWAG